MLKRQDVPGLVKSVRVLFIILQSGDTFTSNSRSRSNFSKIDLPIVCIVEKNCYIKYVISPFRLNDHHDKNCLMYIHLTLSTTELYSSIKIQDYQKKKFI
jgi:hypothetical protein